MSSSRRTPRTGGGSTNRSLLPHNQPLSINDSSHGVGSILSSTSYATGTQHRISNIKATRSFTFGHYDRANEEAKMHLGAGVMTTSQATSGEQAHVGDHNFPASRGGLADSNYAEEGLKFSSQHAAELYEKMAVPESATNRSSYRSQQTARSMLTGRSERAGSADPFNSRSARGNQNQNQNQSRSNMFSNSSPRPTTTNSNRKEKRAHHNHRSHKKKNDGDEPAVRKKHGHHEMSITGHVRNKTMSDHIVGVDPEERLRITREAQGHDDIHAVGEDTEWAAPKPSFKYGCELKSQWMDPENNPIPPSQTYSHYCEKIKKMNMPHISYDIDGDGVVGSEDLFMAKRFDIDGNGVLDDEEQHIGKQIIAEQFFANHDEDLELYGSDFLGRTKEENISRLANMKGNTFKKRLQELKNIEKNLQTCGSMQMKAALTCWNPEIIKHNYFVDKFDATAWNDFGAPGPRDKLFHLSTDHKGSLDTLKNLRKNKDKHYCQKQLDDAKQRELDASPWMKGTYFGSNEKTSFSRTADMTNQRILNTVRRDDMYSGRSFG